MSRYSTYIKKGKKDQKDPVFWFKKANAFMALSLFLIQEYEDLGGARNKILTLVALETLPTNASTSAELFMKAYLIAKGRAPDHVSKFRHDLEGLRKLCSEYDPKSFNNPDLKDICGSYGEYITSGGGIRYPDRPQIEIRVSSYEFALKHLRKILKAELSAATSS